eukprot:Gregarina_sp_Poly_1__1868@NODE_1487_length_4016_cov_1152_468726_g985_i0_p4_GENE_NODE_1487_length_4016_cov_1152_468726_g985_i0NODE_1487_length_4016_cov_1152_468726_g985_i0_p4_ORF_typecomplete_len102_score9_85DUF4014/PF13198_6/4_5e03DUF4014/PF13198_6/0_018_NODE_1487_length_4016_cov_1152_468726_g985_i014931798
MRKNRRLIRLGSGLGLLHLKKMQIQLLLMLKMSAPLLQQYIICPLAQVALAQLMLAQAKKHPRRSRWQQILFLTLQQALHLPTIQQPLLMVQNKRKNRRLI